jgi:2-polyprenyl-3-methyl-5-hydroxy-6-metoxy-1,4-benzoquinol methylase
MRYEFKRLDVLGAFYPNHPHHNVRHVAVKDAILRCDATQLLVLGCGKGLVEYLLPDGLRCISLDLGEKEIEAASRINRYKQNREFRVGDIFRVAETLGERKFPVVAISEVIEHLDDDELALRNACEHVLPGGCLVLTVPNEMRFHNWLLKLLGRKPFLMTGDHMREYTFASASRLLTKVGLSIVRWRGVWFDFPRPYQVEKFISPYSKARTILASLFPHRATYFLFVCTFSGS